jgi:hypothetical protein
MAGHDPGLELATPEFSYKNIKGYATRAIHTDPNTVPQLNQSDTSSSLKDTRPEKRQPCGVAK